MFKDLQKLIKMLLIALIIRCTLNYRIRSEFIALQLNDSNLLKITEITVFMV